MNALHCSPHRRTLDRFRSIVLVVSCVWSACGGSNEPASNTPADVSDIAGPPRPWAEMDHDQKRRYMAERVLPTMAELFIAFDGERFADFNCMTCHGDNAAAVNFHMPNRLPVLWPSGTPEQQRMVELQPDMARFMFNKVLPTMTKLLGQPAWDNEERTGFSCFNCHAKAQTEAEARIANMPQTLEPEPTHEPTPQEPTP